MAKKQNVNTVDMNSNEGKEKALATAIELIEKLSAARPENIASLSRIPGMTPAGIMVVLRKIKA